MNIRLTHLTVILCLLSPLAAVCQSSTTVGTFPSFSLDNLNRYITSDFIYTHDYVSNTGGAKEGQRNIGALDLYLQSDFSKFSRVNGEVMIHYTHINRNDDRAAIGDAQTASNIDMPGQVDRLTDLYYQHKLSDNFKILAGIHDISTEFYVTESSLNFLNSSFGTGAELSVSGINGPSIYPVTTVGSRAYYQIDNELSLRTGVYDGDPGDQSTFRKMGSGIGGSEGYLIISELNHTAESQKLAFGAWNYTKPLPKITDEAEKATSYGLYGTYESELSTNFWGFIRLGWATPSVTTIHNNIVTGLVYRGIFQTKKNQDEVGVGMARANFSNTVKNETAFEGYYHFKPMKILALRPDVQFIKNPSGALGVADAWALGLRTVVEL